MQSQPVERQCGSTRETEAPVEPHHRGDTHRGEDGRYHHGGQHGDHGFAHGRNVVGDSRQQVAPPGVIDHPGGHAERPPDHALTEVGKQSGPQRGHGVDRQSRSHSADQRGGSGDRGDGQQDGGTGTGDHTVDQYSQGQRRSHRCDCGKGGYGDDTGHRRAMVGQGSGEPRPALSSGSDREDPSFLVQLRNHRRTASRYRLSIAVSSACAPSRSARPPSTSTTRSITDSRVGLLVITTVVRSARR